VNYDGWDADKILGCVCDPGWEGYDCANRVCPYGRDPLAPEAETHSYKSETYILQCQADSGYFSIYLRGMYTQPIPYDADPG
jgi:hypothetical protein